MNPTNVKILREAAAEVRGIAGQIISPRKSHEKWVGFADSMDEAVETLELINELRGQEGNGVGIACDNPDFGGPASAVVANGEWTNWEDRSFFGPTVLDALREARDAMKAAPSIRRCRKCGCTDDDCRQCIEKTGGPCHWVEDDLCSACQ